MSADARTSIGGPLFTAESAGAFAQSIAHPEIFEAFLSAIRARRARVAALPIPAPAKPIETSIDIQPS